MPRVFSVGSEAEPLLYRFQEIGPQRRASGFIGKDCNWSLAATLVQPGETIFLDAGTTVFAMAKALRSVPNLTVVTKFDPGPFGAMESARASHGGTWRCRSTDE